MERNREIMSEKNTRSDVEGQGLAVGALDMVLLLFAVAAVLVLVWRWRKRGKKEIVRSVSVPSLS